MHCACGSRGGGTTDVVEGVVEGEDEDGCVAADDDDDSDGDSDGRGSECSGVRDCDSSSASMTGDDGVAGRACLVFEWSM